MERLNSSLGLALMIFVLVSLPVDAMMDRQLLFNKLYSTVEDTKAANVVYELDFSRAPNEADNPSDWFSGKGFQSKFASKIKLNYENNGISFAARSSAIAVWGKQEEIPEATKVRIEWGVLKYPSRANYEKGKANAAINFNVAFGKKTFSSGSPFVPAAPYFFSLFPGEKEPLGKFYKHRYWTKTSRHVCVESGAQEGELLISEFELAENFSRVFGKNMPPISGFAIAINTNARSKAFIKKITFLK